MTNNLSRRRFLKSLTALGGIALGAPVARAAKPRRRAPDAALTPEQVWQNYAFQEEYQSLSRQPVYGTTLTPHWLTGNICFWYRNDGPRRTKAFLRVDAEHGERAPAFDHKKLAAGLTQATGTTYRADRLPFDTIVYTDDGKAVQFAVGDQPWQCDLTSYVCTRLPADSLPATEAIQEDKPGPDQPAESSDLPSPDGRWTAFVRDHNVHVRAQNAAQEVALTRDGTADAFLRWPELVARFAHPRRLPGPRRPGQAGVPH